MLILIPLLGVLGLILGMALAVAAGSPHVSAIMVAAVCAVIVGIIAKAMASDQDRSWLPTLIMAGFTAKLVGAWARWWILVDYYGGSGDASGYYGKAIDFVHQWRAFSPPPMSIGTEAMEGLGGLVFFPYVPNFLGGFFLYATLSFFGQMFLYAAFRTSVVPRRLKLYAAAIFFVPNLVYWPSSIGKEAIMMLGIGMAAYGISKLLNEASSRALLPIAGGLFIAGIIRPHVSAMLCVGATVALLVAKKGTGVGAFPAKRLMLLGFVGAGLAVMMFVAASKFNLNVEDGLDTEQVDTFLEGVEDQTAKGGSEVDGGFISSPAEFPEATIRVLFRPLPNEAHNPPALASAFEGLALLLLTIWKLPAMLRRGFRLRRDPYLIFCVVFTIAFIIAFSSFLNLGLMARERAQVMPFLLAMIVALGFGPPPVDEEEEDQVAPEPDERIPGIEDLLVGSGVGRPGGGVDYSRIGS